MDKTFEENISHLKNLFTQLTPEQKYSLLIDLGRNLAPCPLKTPSHLVRGCQSALYLNTHFEHGKLFFTAASDALISAGLAAVLIRAYSGLPPEILLTHPPTFLSELGISTSLSLNRSNGLAHIHLKMKQEALKFLIQQ